MKFSVIVPTLDEEEYVLGALRSVERHGPPVELVVADGGSRDATLSGLPDDVRVVRTEAGRARQMNAGARASGGDVLLFLHADCRLADGSLGTAALSLEEPAVVGGGFHKRFDGAGWPLRGARWRTSTWHGLGAMFGDQALFVRRADFEAVGGFREGVPAEDLDLVRRLRTRGRLVLLPPEVTVSARRLRQDGILPTWARWWWAGLRQVTRRRSA